MPRAMRRVEAGMIYHVLNRGNGRRALFSREQDFLSFLQVLDEALRRFAVDLLSYCLMGNHWHLLLRPRTAAALSQFMAWVTVTHARRHHMCHPRPGTGHIYQGRYKSFPVESDEHFLTVARYLHGNPVRAGLVKRAEAWRWSDATGRRGADLPLAEWPVERPRNWLKIINTPLPGPDADRVEQSLKRGTPFGSPQWVKRTAAKLNLRSTLNPRGRPKKPRSQLHPRYRRALESAEKHG